MGLNKLFEKMNRHITPILFVLVFAVYFFSRVSYITDSRWTLQTSWAIIHQHNLKLDVFKSYIEKNDYYGIDSSNGHLYYFFPIGTPVLCVPVLYVLEQIGKRVFYFDIINSLQGPYQGGLENFMASLFTALSVLFLWLVLRQWQIEDWLARLLVIAFAFGTSAWSTTSRGLYSHGPTMLFFTAGMWALNKANAKSAWLYLAGFLFSYAYIIRATSSIPVALFTVYVVWHYRFAAWQFLLTEGIVLLSFFMLNYHLYGHFLSPYYQLSHMDEEHHHALMVGLVGTMFSPSRGLFPCTPFLLLLFPAVYYGIKRRVFTSLHAVFIGCFVLHTLLISYYSKWYGGWCFGPRFFADIMPFLVLLLAAGLQAILLEPPRVRKLVFGSFIVLTAASCWINAQGANNMKTFEWNYIPNNIDEHRERLWDWKDIQFLR